MDETGADIWWRPQPGEQWQWQLSGKLDTSVDVPIYDIDWQSPRPAVDQLHRDGRRVVAYLSVGTCEAFRDDAGAFPRPTLGSELRDWPDERWLDVRRIDLLAPVLLPRLDECRRRGFDAVEPDNVDGWTNDTGFPLSSDDQLRFNRWVAEEAHARGLGVALKNDLDQAGELVEDVDFVVNEECLAYGECEALQPFVRAGKAVLHAEYDLTPDEFRARTPLPGVSSILKRRQLDAWRFA